MLPAGFQDSRVCVVGLGYVGLTLAVAMADVGFHVHGLEKRDDVLKGLKKAKAHFWEQGLDPKLARVIEQGRFSTSRELDPSVKASVYIITVGTPLGEDGHARLDMVQAATRQVAEHMDDGALVILRSTVKLGTGRNVVRPILEATGKSFHLAACPERTLEGRALIELFELPQIIGADDRETALRAAQIFQFLTPTIVRVNRLETGELIKLVDNTYRDVTFAFANEVARIAEAVGIDAQEVIRSGKLAYPRTNVAWPGPVGGPCLEKDPHILTESARSYGIELDITPAGRRINERLPAEAADTIAQFYNGRLGASQMPRIAMMGWAFKGEPATDDLRGTMALPIRTEIERVFPGAAIIAYDSVVPKYELEKLGLETTDTIEDAFSGADIVILMNNHRDLRSMPIESYMALTRRPAVVFDFWNSFSNVDLNIPERTAYLGLGGARRIGGDQRGHH